MKLQNRIIMGLAHQLLVGDASEFKESDHPRGPDGRFAKGSGGGGGKKSEPAVSVAQAYGGAKVKRLPGESDAECRIRVEKAFKEARAKYDALPKHERGTNTQAYKDMYKTRKEVYKLNAEMAEPQPDKEAKPKKTEAKKTEAKKEATKEETKAGQTPVHNAESFLAAYNESGKNLDQLRQANDEATQNFEARWSTLLDLCKTNNPSLDQMRAHPKEFEAYMDARKQCYAADSAYNQASVDRQKNMLKSLHHGQGSATFITKFSGIAKGPERDRAEKNVAMAQDILSNIVSHDRLPNAHVVIGKAGDRGCYKPPPDKMMRMANGAFGSFKKPNKNGKVGEVCVARDAQLSTYIHEMAHGLEFDHPWIKDEAAAFLKKRSGGEEAKKLSKITGHKGFRNDEIAIEDSWEKKGGSPYVGKIYNHRDNGETWCTEVLSMGFERMAMYPVEFAKKDPEYFDFIMRIAQGEPKK